MWYWNTGAPWATFGWIGLGICLIFMVLMALGCLWMMRGRPGFRSAGAHPRETGGEPEDWRQEVRRLDEQLRALRDQR